ncbi:MAG: flagellin [Bacillota bacterium]
MRINHNIAALNTYRQLNSASTAQGKSMEKLSSGLRINKAGDDAAGLAISEKMRGQIRGLDRASANAQDAISMIQTAEGALSETTDILQRMRELATQAANDTNTKEDRGEIQKEINQLTSEINRIGNTTEFNTQKLLKGDIAITGEGKVVDSFTAGGGLRGAKAAANGSIGAGSYTLEVIAENKNASIGQTSSNITGASLTSGESTKLAGGMYNIKVTSETATVVDKDTPITDDSGLLNTANNNQAITVAADSGDIGAQTITVTKAQVSTLDSDSGLAMKADATTTDKMQSGTYTVETARVIGDGAKITDKGGADKLLEENVVSNFKVVQGASAADVEALNNGSTDITMTIGSSGVNGEAKITFSDGTKSVDIITKDANYGAKTIQLGALEFDVDITKALSGVTDLGSGTANVAGGTYTGQKIGLGTDFINDQVTVTKGGQSETQSVVSSAAATSTLTFTTVGGGFKMDLTAADFKAGSTEVLNVDSKYTVTDGTDTEVIMGNDIHSNTDVSSIKMGDAFISLNAEKLNQATVGAHTIKFTTESGTAYTAQVVDSAGNGVSGSGKFALDSTLGAGATVDLGNDITLTYKGTSLATGKIDFAVNQEESDFDIKMSKGGLEVETVKVKAGEKAVFENGITLETNENLAKDNVANFNVKSDLVDNSLQMQIGANAGQSFSIDIGDMRSSALNIAGTSSDSLEVKDGDETYTAKFTTSNGVTNGTTSVEAEAALDVTTHENATAAIKVLNNAIEKVSTERSKLGAFQNRLDHTINNLGTSSENLTAAESRIRDVDYALAA